MNGGIIHLNWKLVGKKIISWQIERGQRITSITLIILRICDGPTKNSFNLDNWLAEKRGQRIKLITLIYLPP
jgi:hypothetical protein